MVGLTSAGGIISLLDESEEQLKIYALQRLNSVVDQFWAEISEAISKIEILYEDECFPQRKLSALVASKVYYHLGEFDDSLTFALGAGELFDTSSKSEYVETIIYKYISLRTRQYENPSEEIVIDPRLEVVVERMFQRCFSDDEFKQAIGIALESHRLDVIEHAILKGQQASELLSYVLDSCMTLVLNLDFRNKVSN
ncbi:15919_t:CDS:2 [Entrophospora sp. SA101]|nr:15919_t:CDS:2 [Entrophospora sp. SA101]